MNEAHLHHEQFNAPDVSALDVLLLGLSLILEYDEDMLDATGPVYYGLYAYRRRARILGRDPA